VRHVYRGRVHAAAVRQNLPWLYGLYRGRFLDLAQEVSRYSATYLIYMIAQ
jgi:hypothetical protein